MLKFPNLARKAKKNFKGLLAFSQRPFLKTRIVSYGPNLGRKW